MPTYTHLYTHKYTYTISIQTKIHSFKGHPYLSIPIVKMHIRYTIWTEKDVDLYLYDQLQFNFLEKSNFSSDFNSFIFN